MSDALKYGFLVSGQLGLSCLKSICSQITPVFVFTDSNSSRVVEFCAHNNIPVFIGNPRKANALTFVADKPVDVILSINYLFLIEQDLIAFPRKYAINLHGSLLPKYRGRTPHVWSIINNEVETGITAHLISEECDAGNIISQLVIPISPEMTGADLLEIYADKYPALLFDVIAQLESGNLKTMPQDENAATYFGKRTPEDGMINWSWDKLRIMNWVRAQAKPYPGAFTYYEDRKIIVHRLAYHNCGFHYRDIDGLILRGGPNPVVKTTNGAVQLLDIESEMPAYFEKGKVFYANN